METRSPCERPRLTVLICYAAWWWEKESIDRVMQEPHAFTVVDLLALPYYESRGWRFVALDPESEALWAAWRRDHPEAV